VKNKKNLSIIGLEGIGLCVCVFLIFSCLGFDIADAPSDYAFPHNNPVSNWCGPIGAFFAYYLLYYLGPGVYVLLTAIGWSLGVWYLGNVGYLASPWHQTARNPNSTLLSLEISPPLRYNGGPANRNSGSSQAGVFLKGADR